MPPVSRRALFRDALALALLLRAARRLHPPAARAGSGPEAHGQLLAFNDLHGALLPRPLGRRQAGGVAALGAHLGLRRAGRAESLTVHGGDLIGASPPISALQRDEPAILSLDPLGVDLGTVGNHEFDRGPAALHRLQAGSPDPDPFPGTRMQHLAANVIERTTGTPVFPPYAVRLVDGVPVAFIGVTLRETPSIVLASMVAGLDFLDEAATINRYAAELSALGVNAVVALVHQGGEGSLGGGPVAGAAINRIVSTLDPAVGVVISGHSHRGYQGHIAGRLVTQAFAFGTALAEIALTIDRHSGRIVAASAEVVTTYADSVALDPALVEQVAVWEEAVRPLVERPVGVAGRPITRAASAAGESALGNLVSDAMRAALGAQIAFMNPGGLRADLPAGPVTWGQLFSVLPFGNGLTRLTLTGAQLVELLNQQWADPERPRILKSAGLRYSWDAGTPAQRVRLEDIALDDGMPLRAAGRYTVAVNTFNAAGGDGFTVLTEAEERVPGPVDLDALVSYIEALPRPFTARIEGRIARRGTVLSPAPSPEGDEYRAGPAPCCPDHAAP